MTTLPLSTFWDTSKTEGEANTGWFQKMLSVIKELPGGAESFTELTISAGSITPTAAGHTVDTEADAVTDDLSVIDVTNMPEGRRIVLRVEDATRSVVVKHLAGGTGQISLKGETDLTLSNTTQLLELILIGTTWYQIGLTDSYTADRAVITDSSGNITASSTTSAEVGYLSGVTSNIQTQFNNETKAILTNTGDMVYANSPNELIRLGLGAAGYKLFVNQAGTLPEWGEGFKVGSFTRDTSLASGTQSITGVGFQPSAIILLAEIDAKAEMSVGFSDGSSHVCIYDYYNILASDSWAGNTGAVIYLIQTPSIISSAYIQSFDVDGFTLYWTTTGAKTGTAGVHYLALR